LSTFDWFWFSRLLNDDTAGSESNVFCTWPGPGTVVAESITSIRSLP